MNNTYTIYKRITPDGYVYVGCTVRDVVVRAGYKGTGYMGQPFYDKIQEVGWENITTEIVAQTEDAEQARNIESETIQTAIQVYGKDHILNSETSSHYSWNSEARKNLGEASKTVERTEEWKAKIAQTVKEQWQDAERKTQIVEAIKQNWQDKSDEERQEISEHISEGVKAYYANPENLEKHRQSCKDPERRAKLSEGLKNSDKVKEAANRPERNEKLRNSLQAYFTEDKRREMSIKISTSEACIRATQDPERNAKISEAGKGRKWVTNGIENRFVKGDELTQCLNNGYRYGRVNNPQIRRSRPHFRDSHS